MTKLYVIRNSVSGGFALTLKTSGGTGIAVPSGATMLLWCDGTNVVDAVTRVSSLTLASALSVSSGGTGLATLTAKSVLVGNGTSAVTGVAPGSSNNVLYSDGTDWVAGPLPSSSAVSSFSAGTTGLTPGTPTTGNIVLAGTLAVANGGTGQTSYTDGQLLIGNTSGNTLAKATLTAGTGISISNGAGSITITNNALGTPTLNVVTGTTQSATANNQYVLTNASATTVTLPGSPSAGDVVWVTVGNGRVDNVIARNGQNIMGLAEDMTLNNQYAAVQLRYVDATRGWRMV